MTEDKPIYTEKEYNNFRFKYWDAVEILQDIRTTLIKEPTEKMIKAIIRRIECNLNDWGEGYEHYRLDNEGHE